MATKVNLDALIPREDFEITSEASQSQFVQTTQIRDLEKGAFFYAVLRKPDFQRETSDWVPDKIAEFVQSFLEGDLIPAIILWNSGNYNFVIDGAHRLSALISWVHDDYGDGESSRLFFEGRIPHEQEEVARTTRNLIARKLGSYENHKLAVQYPSKFDTELVDRARRLASLAVQLQWVKGDANKAEESFFKINQQATPIDPTELRLLKSRKNPNALAARAIVRSGTGHKYWSKFEVQVQSEIEAIAKEINTNLFTPTLRTPIKTLDLPVAGRGYSSQTLPLIFELVNLANDVKTDKQLSVDVDGTKTVKFLKDTRRVVYRISGTHPSSLGLHPAVYFYSSTGRYQPTAFLATAAMIKEFERKDYYKIFTRHRRNFENFWLKHKIFINQVTYKLGSGTKGLGRIQHLFEFILECLVDGRDESCILEDLKQDARFQFLIPNDSEISESHRDFTTDVKSAAFLRDALNQPMRCKICGGLIHSNSITIDHVIRREDGGLGTIENANLTHPYCNTTYKN